MGRVQAAVDGRVIVLIIGGIPVIKIYGSPIIWISIPASMRNFYSKLIGYELLHQQYPITKTITWDTFNNLG